MYICGNIWKLSAEVGVFDISQRGGNMTGNGGWCLTPVEMMQTIEVGGWMSWNIMECQLSCLSILVTFFFLILLGEMSLPSGKLT